MGVDIRIECYGIANRLILSNNYIGMTLDLTFKLSTKLWPLICGLSLY